MKAIRCILLIVLFSTGISYAARACDYCAGTANNLLSPVANSLPRLIPPACPVIFDSGTLSIPDAGGEVFLAVASFSAYRCNSCNQYNDAGTCHNPNCSQGVISLRALPLFPTLLTLNDLPLFMTVYYDDTTVTYRSDVQNARIILELSSNLPSSGYLRFTFSGFSKPVPDIQYPFIKSATALTPGSIQLSGDEIICRRSAPGPILSLSPAGGGNGTYTYQWQKTFDPDLIAEVDENGNVVHPEIPTPGDAGIIWQDIPGAGSTTYQPSLLIDTACFRRKVSSGLETAYTNPVRILPVKTCVSPLTPGAIALGAPMSDCASLLCINNQTLPTGAYWNFNYYWEKKDPVTDIVVNLGTGASSYCTQVYTLAPSAYLRRVVTSGEYSAATDWLYIEVPETTLEPGQIVYSGDRRIPEYARLGILSLTGPLGGNCVYTYQWQWQDATGYTENIPGATSSSYQPPALTKSTSFRCRVQSGNQGAYTEWITFSIERGPLELAYYTTHPGLNYIVNCTPQEPVKYLYELPKTDQQRVSVVQYYDGLGRLIQTVQPLQTPQGQDLLSAVSYDAYGRESKRHLPVTRSGNDGKYVSPNDYAAAANSLYGSDASRAFTEIRYEDNPLDRIAAEVMSGANWTSHPVQYTYGGNREAVASWRCQGAHSFTAISYPVGSLFVKETADANGHPRREYTDKLGRVIMLEAQDSTNRWIQTHYVYDELGLQRAIVMPNAASVQDEGNCFYYNYDARRRLIESKVPGADWVHNVYDKRDRLVYSQDGKQRNKGEWTVYEYDDLNRETQVYLLNSAPWCEYSRTDLQNKVNNGTIVVPDYLSKVLLRETWYDSYSRILHLWNNWTYPPNFERNDLVESYSQNNKGRITTTCVYTLNGSRYDLIYTRYYYDDDGRVVQTASTNGLGGVDRTSTQYDFRGNPLQSLQQSYWIGNSDYEELSLKYTFEYDAVKRPIAVSLQLNDQPAVKISQTRYDELLRVSKKTLHGGAEAITYAYNIQGWLSSINSPLFAENLYYEAPPQGVTPQFNGNIAALRWQTPNKGTHYYSFGYDGLDRLRSTQYAPAGLQWSNAFTEQLSYDKNSNITALKRYDGSGVIDNLSYTYIGNQVQQITDNATAQGYPLGASAYSYDANGNITKEGTTQIAYNLLNLPSTVTLTGGRKLFNSYAADGRKLSTVARNEQNELLDGSKTYNGNLVFDKNLELEYILFPEGRILNKNANFVLEYHLKDHLGSVRVAFEAGAAGNSVVQENAFYPFGALIGSLSSGDAAAGANRYKHTGKETISDFELGFVDNGARWRLNALSGIGFGGIDPLAAKYPWITPYAYCLNNPVKYIDPNGKDAVLVVYPDYKILTPVGKIGGLGHAGVLLIDNKTGTTKYYEYGRYDKEGKGEVRNIKISNVKIGKGGKPTQESLNKVMRELSDRAGKGGKIDGAYIESDDFKSMNDYAKSKKTENSDSDRKSYGLTDNNCGTFAADVVKQDEDVKKNAPSIVDPRPNSIVGEYQDKFKTITYDPKKDKTEIK